MSDIWFQMGPIDLGCPSVLVSPRIWAAEATHVSHMATPGPAMRRRLEGGGNPQKAQKSRGWSLGIATFSRQSSCCRDCQVQPDYSQV